MIENDCIQGSEEWATARRGIPTASGASKIVTPAKGDLSSSRFGYACELIAELMLPPNFWLSEVNTAAMQMGTNTEREARDYFALEKGVEVREVGFCLTDDRRFGCSPDGLIGDDEGLELKCPLHKTHVKYLVDGVLPLDYKPQVHWSLVVTGRKRWNFMSYALGLPPLIIVVEPDEYTDKVRSAMEQFHATLTEMKAKIAGLCDDAEFTEAREAEREAFEESAYW